MRIRNRKVYVYDVEIFPNAFHCCCKDTESGQLHKFEISNRRNQLDNLVDFFYYDSSEKMFCGYNNHHYDDVIINYIIDYYYKLSNMSYLKICQSLYNLSKYIVETEDEKYERIKRWKYAHYFESMDLLTMQFSKKLRVGLKTMQVTMHYKNDGFTFVYDVIRGNKKELVLAILGMTLYLERISDSEINKYLE